MLLASAHARVLEPGFADLAATHSAIALRHRSAQSPTGTAGAGREKEGDARGSSGRGGALSIGGGARRGSASSGGRPSVVVPRGAIAPVIDGLLDDSVWQAAARITTFTQQRPVEGAPATEDTEVSITYDSRNLYFGIYAHYSDPKLIRANHADRDKTSSDDTVSLFFDPFLDQQRAYVFSVNAYGVQGDAIMNTNARGGGAGPGPGGGGGGGGGGAGGGGGGQYGEDPSWDALFSSRGRLVADGWTAEIAIPFKSLRYPAKGEGQVHRWGFQIQRDIESKNESVVWSPVSRDVMGFIRQMGMLEGASDLSTSRNLEVLPTFTAVKSGALDAVSGVFQGADASPEAGINVKYGITSKVTADVTFNPDFSQIESDRAQIDVNQRFPLFYPELRPFFIEGQEVFDLPSPVTFVHTRTIVDPRYGAKLTGKVGKMSLGLVVANDEAPGRVDDPADPALGRSAHVVLARARYDVFADSTVGLIATDRELMNGYSRLGGVDGQFRIGRNHRLSVKLMASDRVDATTSQRRFGPMLDIGFRKEGRSVSYGISHWAIHPDFGTDVGFVRRVDMRQTNTSFGYRWWPEGRIVNWGPRVSYNRNYDFTGVLQDEQRNASINVQFAKSITLGGGVNRDMERYGGVDFQKSRWFVGGGINTSRRISLTGSYGGGDQIRYETDPFLGRGANANLTLTLRPFSRLQSQVDVITSDLMDPRNNTEVFKAKIYRGQTTYQFTDRLLARNISEYNSLNRTWAVNLLATYRLNAGTVFFVGYDDHYQQGDKISATVFPDAGYRRTNRAFFTKLQYLFRY